MEGGGSGEGWVLILICQVTFTVVVILFVVKHVGLMTSSCRLSSWRKLSLETRGYEWMRSIDDVGDTQKYHEATHMQLIQSRPKTECFIKPDAGNRCSHVTGNVKS